MPRARKRVSSPQSAASDESRRVRLDNGPEEAAHSSQSQLVADITKMHLWVADLNKAINRNVCSDDTLEEKFGNKIDNVAIYQHPSFWAKLIGSVITQIKHRPEATLGWIHYSVVLMLNRIDASLFQMPATSVLLKLLKPFIVSDSDNFFAGDCLVDLPFQFDTKNTPNEQMITVQHKSQKGTVEIARITKSMLPLMQRNTCLVLAMVLSLYNRTQVQDVLHLLRSDLGPANIDAFLKKAISTATEVQVTQRPLPLLSEPMIQVQTAVYAMICIQKCLKEFPNEIYFKQSFEEIIPELEYLADLEMAYGKLRRQLSKQQIYVVQMNILAHSTVRFIRSTESHCFIRSAPSDANPIASGYWVFGNVDANYHALQVDMNQHLMPNSQYYCEFRVLTFGSLLVGFAPALSQDNDQAPNVNWVAETVNSVFFDPYSGSVWRDGRQVKTNRRNLPSICEGTTLGILLDTSKASLGEAVAFSIDGHAVKPDVAVNPFPVVEHQIAPWLASQPRNFFLTFALTAYQQGVAVFQRDNWKHAQYNAVNQFTVPTKSTFQLHPDVLQNYLPNYFSLKKFFNLRLVCRQWDEIVLNKFASRTELTLCVACKSTNYRHLDIQTMYFDTFYEGNQLEIIGRRVKFKFDHFASFVQSVRKYSRGNLQNLIIYIGNISDEHEEMMQLLAELINACPLLIRLSLWIGIDSNVTIELPMKQFCAALNKLHQLHQLDLNVSKIGLFNQRCRLKQFNLDQLFPRLTRFSIGDCFIDTIGLLTQAGDRLNHLKCDWLDNHMNMEKLRDLLAQHPTLTTSLTQLTLSNFPDEAIQLCAQFTQLSHLIISKNSFQDKSGFDENLAVALTELVHLTNLTLYDFNLMPRKPFNAQLRSVTNLTLSSPTFEFFENFNLSDAPQEIRDPDRPDEINYAYVQNFIATLLGRFPSVQELKLHVQNMPALVSANVRRQLQAQLNHLQLKIFF